MSDLPEEKPIDGGEEKKSLFGVIIHSFFVVPFLIAVFSVLVFASIRMLTMEKHTIYDHLDDIKIGGLTKRWQAAFELSKILADPNRIPKGERFKDQLIGAFKHAHHDDNRVRQYLALAMGRTEDLAFVEPLMEGLKVEKEENLAALIYALGMLRDKETALSIHPFLEHSLSKVRLAAVMALGNIANPLSVEPLKKALHDPEPNVGWDAAIALAKLKDPAGKGTLLNLLNREFLLKFPEVDQEEQNHTLQVALEAASKLGDPELDKVIQELGKNDPNMNVRKLALSVTE